LITLESLYEALQGLCIPLENATLKASTFRKENYFLKTNKKKVNT
jgi:hypothetical protein